MIIDGKDLLENDSEIIQVENEELPHDSIQNDEQTAEPIPLIGDDKSIKSNEDNQIQQRAYPGREHRVPERLKDYVLCAARDIDNIKDPKSVSEALVAALIEQLVLIRYSECSGMDEYLNKKMKIAQQLKAIDTEIKSEVLAALIFVSIPDYFKPLIMALGNCGLELTTDLVKGRVLKNHGLTMT
ncbi:hypothetical protein JTB14_023431 [Gonioctena quinquepunctata]|nr:hypothetical protein JTB14_023431 [Gonioctena quinquepunctata]